MTRTSTETHAATANDTVPRSAPPAGADRRTSLADPMAAPAAAGGPLLAVCALHGGAGASILANVIARTAAAAADLPMLLCEAPGATGDQAALTGAPSRLSLAELALAVVAGRAPRGFWGRSEQLRVLATAPQPAPALDARLLSSVLAAACGEHALTVVDVGGIRHPHAPAILRAATHVLWVLRLTPDAITRAQLTLASGFVPALAAEQAIAARGVSSRERFGGQAGALRRLAVAHSARLVLVPELALADGRPDLGSSRARRLAGAVAPFLGVPCRA